MVTDRSRRLLLCMFLCTIATGAIRAEPQAPEAANTPSPESRTSGLSIPSVTNAPSLADTLSRQPLGAAVVTDFRQNKPGDGLPVSLSTTAYVS